MKISYKCDYALKAILYLSHQYQEDKSRVVPLAEIAENGDIPFKFLEQVILQLKNGGFVESKRGPSGGYTLAKAPKNISVGDIIRLIEGPITPIACIEGKSYPHCKDCARCVFRDIWKKVKKSISGIVDESDFETLARSQIMR